MAGLLVVAGCAKETASELSPAGSDFLVLKADVADLTKTDISEGNSTWEAGDVITVVYDGAAYEYVAQSAGETTTFTSAAGITTYDATKPLTAYYPATDVTGTIKIESEKTLAFKINSAEYGLGKSGKMYVNGIETEEWPAENSEWATTLPIKGCSTVIIEMKQ